MNARSEERMSELGERISWLCDRAVDERSEEMA